jgi:predicted nuclease of predicted toxin-antitoxin system
MRIFLDTCLSKSACVVLREAGHDVVWSAEWPKDPGDDKILSVAHGEHRILITLDKDFGELAVVRRAPHSGIVRLVGFSAAEQGAICINILRQYGEQLKQGSIVTVNPKRVRVRPSEL